MKIFFGLWPNLAVASATMMGGSIAWAQSGPPLPLLPVMSAPAIPALAANTPSGYVRTTTDTPEYCKELLGRIDKLMRDSRNTAATEARTLSQEGERLCQHGHTKGGILRLRQAYVLLSPAKPGN